MARFFNTRTLGPGDYPFGIFDRTPRCTGQTLIATATTQAWAAEITDGLNCLNEARQAQHEDTTQ
jgi:hypothetical protein